MSKADEINDKKTISTKISVTITFYEKSAKKDTWGSNNISYELYYNTKKGILDVFEIGAFGDSTLVKKITR